MKLEDLKNKLLEYANTIRDKDTIVRKKHAEGASCAEKYDDLYRAVQNKIDAAVEEYANYGSIDKPKKFAPGTIPSDGKTCLNSDCCTATKNLLDAEKALKDYYDGTVKNILDRGSVNAKKLGFLSVSIENILSQYAVIKQKIDVSLSCFVVDDNLIDENAIDIQDLKDKVKELNSAIRKIKNIGDDLGEEPSLIPPLINQSTQAESTFNEAHSQIIEQVEDIYPNHFSCHKETHALRFINCDVDHFLDKEYYIFKHVFDGCTMVQCGETLPVTKGNDHCTFLRWEDEDEAVFTINTTIYKYTDVYACWNINAECEWKVNGESKVTHVKSYKEYDNCNDWLLTEIRSYNESWGATVDNIPENYFDNDNTFVTPNNYKFVIDGKHKIFTVKIAERTKTVDGWTDYSDLANSQQNVEAGKDYNLTDIATNYENAIKDGEYINTPNTRKYVRASDSPSYKNIVADTIISVDVIPLYKVEYFNEFDKVVSTKDKLEIGTQFNIDTNNPDGLFTTWPAKQKEDGVMVYDLIPSPGDYLPRGTITISNNVEVKPQYEETGHKEYFRVDTYTRHMLAGGEPKDEYDLNSHFTKAVKYGEKFRYDSDVNEYNKALINGETVILGNNLFKMAANSGMNPPLSDINSVTKDLSLYFDLTSLFKLEFIDDLGNAYKDKTVNNLEEGYLYALTDTIDDEFPAEYVEHNGKAYVYDGFYDGYQTTSIIRIDSDKLITIKYVLDSDAGDLSSWKYTLSSEFEKEDIDDAIVAPILTDIEREKNLTAEAEGYSEVKKSTAFDSIKTTTNGKRTIKESEVSFINPIKEHYPLIRTEETKSYDKAKNGYSVWSMTKGLPIKTYLENPSIYTGYFKTYTDKYEMSYFPNYQSSFQNYQKEIVKTVIRLPKTADDKRATGAVGWPNEYSLSSIITKDNIKFIINFIANNFWRNKDAIYYGNAMELPYVHFVYGENAMLPGLDIDPEATQQFNPLTDGDFTNKAPTPYNQEGYIGMWREANNQGQLTAEIKELNDANFFNGLSFHYDYKTLPNVHFVYGTGFKSEGNEICSTWFDPRNPSIDFPSNFELTAYKDGYGEPTVCDKVIDDFRRNEGDPNFFDDITATITPTETAKLSASISWVYGQYIYGDSYDGKMLTGQVWLKNPPQQQLPIIIEQYQSYIDAHGGETIQNPNIANVLYNEDKFVDVGWNKEYKLSDLTWTDNPNSIQDHIVELTGNVTEFTVTFRAFTDDIGSLLHVPDHVESDVAYGADLTYTEDDIYHNMLYDINEELANIGYPMSFIEDHPHWYINQNNTKINAMPYLSSVTSNLTVELSAKLNDQY